MHISHVDEIPKDYAKALDACKSIDDLKTAVKLYGEVAKDALDKVDVMDSEDFIDWQHALKKERRGIFMGEDAMNKFGDILMPEVMFKISMTAAQFGVPWGMAYNRLREVGRLKVRHGFAEFIEQP